MNGPLRPEYTNIPCISAVIREFVPDAAGEQGEVATAHTTSHPTAPRPVPGAPPKGAHSAAFGIVKRDGALQNFTVWSRGNRPQPVAGVAGTRRGARNACHTVPRNPDTRRVGARNRPGRKGER